MPGKKPKWRSGNAMASRWAILYKGTDAEKALEDAVAAVGLPYRTQFPCFIYGARWFPDFVLPTLQLVIEVDDDSHKKKNKEDQERTAGLKAKYGWDVVRCTNEEALSNPHGAVKKMLEAAGYWPVAEGLKRLRVADFLPATEKAPKKGEPIKLSRSDARKVRLKTRARGRVVVLPITQGEP